MLEKSKTLILVAGNAGSGKDTLADLLDKNLSQYFTVDIDSFAQEIKNIIWGTFDVPWSVLQGNREVKESTYIMVGSTNTGLTVRDAHIKIGEFFRNTFGKNVWANRIRNRIASTNAPIFIVRDARFPEDEIKWTKSAVSNIATVYTVRIKRPDQIVNSSEFTERQIAEANDDLFDFIINNDGDMTKLIEMAKQLSNAILIMRQTGNRVIKQREGWIVVNSDNNAVMLPFIEKQKALDHAVELNSTELVSDSEYRVVEGNFDLLRGNACAQRPSLL